MQGPLSNIFRTQRSSTPIINSRKISRIKPKGFRIETCSSSSYKKFKKFNIPDSSLTFIHKLNKTPEKLISLKSNLISKPEDREVKFLPSIKLQEIIKNLAPQLTRLENIKIFDLFPSTKLKEGLKTIPQQSSKANLSNAKTANERGRLFQCSRCCSSKHKCKKPSQNAEVQSEPFEITGWETDFE